MAPIRYLESYPNLPPSAPVGHPHIISTAFSESTPKDGLTAADGIATLFFNWKPDALAAFLDVDAVPQFEFVRKEERVAWMNTYVARFGRRVMVSFYLCCVIRIRKEWKRREENAVLTTISVFSAVLRIVMETGILSFGTGSRKMGGGRP